MREDTAILNTIYSELFPKKLTKADRRKIEILESAIHTYAELGIGYVSYEDIARRAKISRPLVQHHFPDKYELFVMAMKLVRAQFQELAVNYIKDAKDPVEKFKEYVRSTFRWLAAYPEHARVWLFFFYLCPSEAGLKKLHAELTEMGQKRAAGLLESGHQSGFFSGGDFMRKAKQIQRVISGSFLELETEVETTLGPAEIERVREECVEHCLLIARS